MNFFINESHLAAGATKDDAVKAVWELQGLGWDVQYGDGPTWEEVLAGDPADLSDFEADFKSIIG